jgi:hypothetical protein
VAQGTGLVMTYCGIGTLIGPPIAGNNLSQIVFLLYKCDTKNAD